MLRFIKQIAGPTVFSKGLTQYNQRNYNIAKQLLLKAVQWMPTLQSDALYQSVICLCDYHMEIEPESSPDSGIDKFQSCYAAIRQSPHKDTPNYTAIASEIKTIIDSAQ